MEKSASRGSSVYQKDIPSPPIKLAGLVLRRKEGKECSPHSRLSPPYKQEDYEVLLRRWTKAPYTGQLCMVSGPMVQGSSPDAVLLGEVQGWTAKLAAQAEMKKAKGLKGQRAVFLTACGEGSSENAATSATQDHSATLCYTIPTTCRESTVVDGFPEEGWYPRFHCLQRLLWQMYREQAQVHHVTKQALSALDHWLREQHALPDGISNLFTPSIVNQMKMIVINPLFQLGLMVEEKKQRQSTSHLHSRQDNAMPRDMSFDLSVMTFEEEEQEIFPEAIEGTDGGWLQTEEDKVDRVVVNPFFGQEVSVNYDKLQAFGVPENNELEDQQSEWMSHYPLHKCACEGDCEGVRAALEGGHQVDEKDDSGYTGLHCACWYSQVDVVELLIEKGNASFNAVNSNGSTPLHIAAGQGHSAVVAYLLTLKEITKDAMDNDGHTPLRVCEMRKKEDWRACVELLKKPDTAAMNVKKLKMSSQVSRGILREKLPETTPELARKSEGTDSKSQKNCRVNLDSGQHRIILLTKGVETTGGEMINSVLDCLGIGSNLNSRFALWVASPSLEIQLGDRDKPMEIVSRWRGLVHHYSGEKVHEIPQLYLRANVFAFPERHKHIHDLPALEILYGDAHRHVVCGDYPCTEDQAIYLAGISLQISQGDFNDSLHKPGYLKERLQEVLPAWLLHTKHLTELERKVLVQYAKISESRHRSQDLLFKEYIKYCSRWPFYGSMYFKAQCTSKPAKLSKWQGRALTLAINPKAVFVISRDPSVLVQVYHLDGLNWDVANEKQELQLTVPSTGESAIFKSKQILLLKNALSKFMQIRVNSLPELG